jgi:plastocyanin
MRGTRAAIAAVGCGVLVGIPALAGAQQQQDPTTGEITAVDNGAAHAFKANGTDASTLTIATGGTVTFDYPAGTSRHNVDFTDAKPSSCTQTAPPSAANVPPLPPTVQGPGWAGTCTFSTAGTYAFRCDLHLNMKGTVVVRDPVVETPTPTPTPSPAAGATPAPTPTAAPVAARRPQSTLTRAVDLSRPQTGSRVRGRVDVQAGPSRLEVTLRALRARLSGGHSGKLVRVGRWRQAAANAGSVAFSVRLSARARRAQHRRHRLRVAVTVTLRPPGGQTLTRTVHVVTLRG